MYTIAESNQGRNTNPGIKHSQSISNTRSVTFKFIHTADWQLGKQFAAIGGDAGAALRDQRMETVRKIGELATQREADAILVAGDVFDDNTVADATLIQTLDALKTFAGDWVFIPGNHDPARAASVWTRLAHRNPPENAHFLTKPEIPLSLRNGTAVVLPAVLQRRHEVDDLTAWFDSAETSEGAIRIGLAHGSIAERLPKPSEATNPISAGRAESARLDYLALGDWHGTLPIDECYKRTWYSGTPETDRFKSSDPGNVLLVSIDGPRRPPRVERLKVGKFIWRSIDWEVRHSTDVEALQEQISSLAPDDPKTCLLSLKISGAMDMAVRAELHAVRKDWKALLRFLQVDDKALLTKPSDDDLDRIDRDVFVRVAVERLRKRASDASDPDRAIAEAALIRLYEEHVKTKR